MRATAGAILDLLGNPTRREILHLIADGPKYFTELSEETGVRKMAIERHIRQLEELGVISSEEERVGRGRPRKYYEISTRAKLKVKISPEIFEAKYWTCRGSGGSEAGNESLAATENIQDPMDRLSALSKIAEEISEDIRMHEEAIARDEELLERIKRAGAEALKAADFKPMERRLLINILLSGKGKRSSEVAEEIGEEPSRVRRCLLKMKSRDILRYDHHNWRIK
jgi:predicted transcriptional regulator